MEELMVPEDTLRAGECTVPCCNLLVISTCEMAAAVILSIAASIIQQ